MTPTGVTWDALVHIIVDKYTTHAHICDGFFSYTSSFNSTFDFRLHECLLCREPLRILVRIAEIRWMEGHVKESSSEHLRAVAWGWDT